VGQWGTGGGGWMYPKGAHSIAMSGLAREKALVEGSRPVLVGALC